MALRITRKSRHTSGADTGRRRAQARKKDRLEEEGRQEKKGQRD